MHSVHRKYPYPILWFFPPLSLCFSALRKRSWCCLSLCFLLLNIMYVNADTAVKDSDKNAPKNIDGMASNDILSPSSGQPSLKSSTTLEEVFVTGSKRKIKRHDYPGAISLIDLERLQDTKLGDIVDVAAMVPGLYAQQTGARNPTPIIIRGINFNGSGANDLGSDGTTVASYVNDIPLQGYYSPTQLMLKDLKKIEVMRGPQGTLYGASALAGLIRYETAKPDMNTFSMQFHSRIFDTAESESFSSDSDIITNVPLVDDTLAARVLLSYTDTAGFIDNDFLLNGPEQDINDEKIHAGRFSLLYEPMDSLSLSFMVQAQDTKVGDRQADNVPFTGREFSASTLFLQPSDGTLDTSSLNVHYDLDSVSLELAIGYYQYDQLQTTDLNGLYHTSFGLPDSLQAFQKSDLDVTQKNIEVRLVREEGDSLQGVFGLFYSTNDLDLKLDEYSIAFPDLSRAQEFRATQNQTLEDFSLYSDMTWSVTDAMSLTFGGRYFRYQDDAEGCTALFSDPLSCNDGADDNDNLSAKLSALFKFNERVNIFASLSEGFRRGGPNPAIPDELASIQSYDPDKTLNYEVGINSILGRERFRFNASAFYIDWSDIQLTSAVTVPSSGSFLLYLANANDAVSQGVELEFEAQLNSHIKFLTSYTYNDARLAENAPNYNGSGDNGFKNDRLPGAPRNQFYLELDFERLLFSSYLLDAVIRGSYLGNVKTQLNNTHTDFVSLGGYSIFDFNIGLSSGAWRVGGFINNFTNKRAVSVIQGATFFGEQGAFEYVNRPRTIGVDLSYRFK